MNFNSPTNILLKTDGKPPFIYGTAWKKGETERLVKEAIGAGFTAIDTAAQPKHYQEELVGSALRKVYSAGTITREDLYIQTKFTSPRGQNLNDMPYDPNAPLEQQIHSSIASSLENLRAQEDLGSVQECYIDTLILHSPLDTLEETIVAWHLFEPYVPNKIRNLGISNTDLKILQSIYEEATVKPAVVQNRFYPRTHYDVELRKFCQEKGIVYESFWTLSGNQGLVKSEPVGKLSRDAGVSDEVALYTLVMAIGIAPLNGTTSLEHMKMDLADVGRVKNWTFVYGEKWRDIVAAFKKLIGDEV